MNRKLVAGIAIAAAAPLAAARLGHRPTLAAGAGALLAAASFYAPTEPEIAIAIGATVFMMLAIVE